MIWYFIGVCIINITMPGRLAIQNFSSRVKKIFHSCFSTLEEKFRISARPCNIPYVFLIPSLFSEGHGGHLGFILMHLFKAYVWSAMTDIDKFKRYPWLDKIWIIRESRAKYLIMIITFHSLVLKSERTMAVCNFGTQLFQERLSEKVHATIPKGIVVGFEFTVLQRIWRNGRRGHGHMFASAEGKQQK